MLIYKQNKGRNKGRKYLVISFSRRKLLYDFDGTTYI